MGKNDDDDGKPEIQKACHLYKKYLLVMNNLTSEDPIPVCYIKTYNETCRDYSGAVLLNYPWKETNLHVGQQFLPRNTRNTPITDPEYELLE
jgi:hypothetical protein